MGGDWQLQEQAWWMMICEKCWADAYRRSYGTGKSQYDCYLELLDERKDNPCIPDELSFTDTGPVTDEADAARYYGQTDAA